MERKKKQNGSLEEAKYLFIYLVLIQEPLPYNLNP
jgi:hypothetical protein